MQLETIKIIFSAFVGGAIAASFGSFARAWKYAKEVNQFRELLANFIDRIALRLSLDYITQAQEAVEVIGCADYEEHRKMVHGKKWETFPMLNSDLLRSMPPVMLKDMLYGKTAFSEIFTFYHCLDFVMEMTPARAFEDYHAFIKEHTKDKVNSHDDFVREFETCAVIANQRNYIIGRLNSRIKRSELNTQFLNELRAELQGSRLNWRLKYFRQALF